MVYVLFIFCLRTKETPIREGRRKDILQGAIVEPHDITTDRMSMIGIELAFKFARNIMRDLKEEDP